MKRDDSGVTLVELLVAVFILGLLITPIATAVTLGLVTAAREQDSTVRSSDAQRAASYFATDVHATKAVLVPAVGDVDCAGNDYLFALESERQSTLTTTDTNTSFYGLRPDTAAVPPRTRLIRTTCRGATELAQVIVSEGVIGTPSLVCDGVACASGATPREVRLEGVVGITGSNEPPMDLLLVGTRRVT